MATPPSRRVARSIQKKFVMVWNFDLNPVELYFLIKAALIYHNDFNVSYLSNFLFFLTFIIIYGQHFCGLIKGIKTKMMQTNSSPWKSITSSLYQVINKTPEKKSKNDFSTVSGSPLPNTFKFTPTKGKKIYPTLNPPSEQRTSRRLTLNSSPIHNQDSNESYLNKDNQSFINAMDTLQTKMFSSNISNKVLNEFSSRYERVRDEKISNIVELNNTTTNEELNRRRSDRFSATHKTRFNRMESIAFHYAAMRKERKDSVQRKLVCDNDFIPSDAEIMVESVGEGDAEDANETHLMQMMTPGDKRLNLKAVESATKRMKLDEELNFKEITKLDSSPTKSINQKENLKKLYQGRLQKESKPDNFVEPERHAVPSYLQPTKASIQRSASSRSISPSKSSASLKLNNHAMYPTPDLQPQGQEPVKSKLSRSPSISPTRSLSKLSPSRACSNLNKILTSSPEKMELESESEVEKEQKFEEPRTRIPRSKTINSVRNGNLHANEIPSMLPRSSTSGSLRNSTISASSSIPRLAHLTNVESKVESKLKKWRY